MNINSAGGVRSASGTTTLNGKVTSASSFAIQGGNIITSGSDNIADTTQVSLTSGSLSVEGNETVNYFQQYGGSLLGSGKLTSALGFNLNGGTISANLGTGNLSVNSAGTTTTLNYRDWETDSIS